MRSPAFCMWYQAIEANTYKADRETDKQKGIAYLQLVHPVAGGLCITLCSQLGSLLVAQSSHHIFNNTPLACHLLHTPQSDRAATDTVAKLCA